jgi:hypothetical protein
MVGGVVIEVAHFPDKIFVDCIEPKYKKETCAIYVEKDEHSLQIEIGDRFWWQGNYAYWTPYKVRESGIGESDIKIKRIGHSGVELQRD